MFNPLEDFLKGSNNSYQSLENDALGRGELKRRDKFLRRVIISVMIIFLFFIFTGGDWKQIKEMIFINPSLYKDIFLFNFNKEMSIGIALYFCFSFFLLFLWFLIIKRKHTSKYFKFINKFNDFFEKATVFLFTPFKFFIFTEQAHKHSFKYRWLDNLEDDFIKQKILKIDGYKRVRKLDVLKDYRKIYTEEEYKHLSFLFVSEEDLIDMLAITEGYLKDVSYNKKGIEKLGNEIKYDRIVNNINENNISHFRAFNGKDEVIFSMDYIIKKTNIKAKEFREFCKKRMFVGSTRVSKNVKLFFELFKEDNRCIDMLLGLDDLEHKKDLNKKDSKYIEFQKNRASKFKAEFFNLKSLIKSLEEENELTKEQQENLKKYKRNLDELEKVLIDLIYEKMNIFFKFIYSRIILQQYVNIPAGSVVVKVSDYTLRGVIDFYNTKKILEIMKNKNDGRSKSFKNDTLLNIFLVLFNTFFYSKKENELDLLQKEINLNYKTMEIEDKELEDIEKAIINMKKYENLDNSLKEKFPTEESIFNK